MLREIEFDNYVGQKVSLSQINVLKEKMKRILFDFLLFLLKYNPLTKRIEIFLVFIQMFQLISFAFEDKFKAFWKDETLYMIFKPLFIYFRLIPFFQGDTSLYLIFLYFIDVLFLLFLFICLIIAIKISRTKETYIPIIQFISITLPIMSTIFFIPIVETLLSIFSCDNGYNTYATPNQMICWDNMYILHVTINIICLILYLLVSFLIQNTYFELKYNQNGYSSKKTLQTDNVLLFNKTVIIISVLLLCKYKITEFILVFIMIIMFYLSYLYTTISPYYFYDVQKGYMMMSYVTTWTFFVLFIGSIMVKETYFNCSFGICLIGNIVICLGILLMTHKINYSLIMKPNMNLSTGGEVIGQIEEICLMMNHTSEMRIPKLLLLGYINEFNSRSIDPNHPLLKYIEGDEYDRKNNLLLILHLHSLYLFGLSKFPDDVRLRIFYAIFIYDGLSRREQAKIELDNAMKYSPIFSYEFIIYRLKDLFENQICPSNSNSLLDDLTDLVTNLNYKNYHYEFKTLIITTSNQYVHFWTILSNSQHGSQTDLSQLNTIGSKIKTNVDKIHNLFIEMKKIKPYNQEVLLDYSSFVLYILNDEDKGKILVNQFKELSVYNGTIDEKNLCSLDLNNLRSVDDYHFIIFSAMPKSLGIITHISISVCALFGYTKEELIGKPIELLLPEMYAHAHRNSLMHIIEGFKQKVFEDYTFYHEYKIIFTENNSYAINKSKYLIPFHYKGAFFPNDNGKQYFFMKLQYEHISTTTAHNQYMCYVLTDKRFQIQNFTANSTTLLGLNSHTMNSFKEITSHIKQLYEDYLRFCTDIDNNNEDEDEDNIKEERRLELKTRLIWNKYTTPAPITWINSNCLVYQSDKYVSNRKQAEDSKGSLTPINPSLSRRERINDDNFILTVSDYGDFGEKQGYIFKLEPIWHYYLKEAPTCIVGSSRDLLAFSRKGKKQPTLGEPEEIFKRLRVGSVESGISAGGGMKINKNYVPEITDKFVIDPKKNSYLQIKDNEPNDYQTQIKEQAYKKQKENTLDNESSSYEYTNDNEEEENEESYSEDINNESNSGSIQEVKLALKSNIKSKKNQIEDSEEYYHVNLDTIKLSLYDFNKRVDIEVNSFKKISEVELKLTQEETNNETIDQFNPINTDKTKKTENSQTSSRNIMKNLFEDKSNHSQKEKIKKEIRKALTKDNIQYTIFLLYILSLATFLLAITKELIFLFHYLHFIDLARDYITLIRYSYKINRNALHCVYSVRELTLTNFPRYIIPDDVSREEYIIRHKNNIGQFFKDNEKTMTIMMKSPIQIPQDLMKKLDSKAGINYYIINNKNYTIDQNNNTFRSAYFAVNYALEHVMQSPIKSIIPTNEDVFFFIYNTMNGLWIGLMEQNELFKEMFTQLRPYIHNIIFVLFFTLELTLIVCYCFARTGLLQVSDKNDSYLSVFFSISKNIILESLSRCEKFIIQFQTQNINDRLNDNTSENNNGLYDEESIPLKHINSVNQVLLQNHDEKASLSKNCSKKLKCFGLFFFGYGIIISGTFAVLIFDCVILAQMFLFEIKIFNSLIIYQSEATIEKESLLIFNLLREEVFDQNTQYLFIPLRSPIEKLITDVYNNIQKEKQKIDDVIQNVPVFFYSHYYQINHKSLCYNHTNITECEEKTDKSALYGLETMIMFFIEEIRVLHYEDVNLKRMNKLFNFVYNFTLNGTPDEKRYYPKNTAQWPMYENVSPMYIFNKKAHQNLSFMYWYLFYPTFENLVYTIGKNIDKECLNTQQFLIISISILIASLVVLVFFIWFPYVNILNSVIYKTKNMLSIIPIDVLASLQNINQLLEINQNYDEIEKETLGSPRRKLPKK